MKAMLGNGDPGSMTEAERRLLTDDLYSIHSEIFDGISKAGFRKYVIDSSAQRSRIGVFRAPDGTPGGYCAVHFYDRELSGTASVIVRIEIGVRRSMRGTGAPGTFLATQLIRERLRHVGRPMFIFACPVHPSSYVALSKRAPEVWPHHERDTPPETERLMLKLADAFGLERADPKDAFIRRVGWITRSTEGEVDYWSHCEHPSARYYSRRNPGYVRGNGMLMLVPLSGEAIAKGVTDWASNQLRRRALRAQARLDRLTRGRSAQAGLAANAIANAPLLAGVSREATDAMVAGARVMVVPAGHSLFRKGDRGDAMYVVLEGSAYVQIGEPPNVEVLDQLRAGDVVGEMALVTGSPRSADVRAASSLHLLRITSVALEQLVTGHPEAAAALWRNVAWIRLEDFTQVRATGRTQRKQRFDAGHAFDVDADRAAQGELFLYEGHANVTIGTQRLRLSAPAMMPADVDLDIVPGARLWWLPLIEA